MPDVLNPDGSISDDRWLKLEDDQSVVADAEIIVSLARWQSQRDALLAEAGAVGVYIDNTENLDALPRNTFDGASLITLHFPAFTDGRAYSQARVLRERLGFTATLRACGEVLHDQLFYMLRCGFDSFEMPANLKPDQVQNVLRTFSVAYQPTASGPQLQRAGSLN